MVWKMKNRIGALIFLMAIIISGCRNDNRSNTFILPEADLAKESESVQTDTKFVSKKIYKYEYNTEELIGNQEQGFRSAFLNEKDKYYFNIKRYDMDNNKTVFDKIDYRFGFHEAYSSFDIVKENIQEIAFSPDGYYLFAERDTKDKRYFILIDLRSKKETELFVVSNKDYTQNIYQMVGVWTKDSSQLIYLWQYNVKYYLYYIDFVHVYNLEKEQVTKKINSPDIAIQESFQNKKLIVSEDGTWLLLQLSDVFFLYCMNLKTGEILPIRSKLGDTVNYWIEQNDIVAVSSEGTIYRYNLKSDYPKWSSETIRNVKGIHDFIICNEGDTIITAESDTTLSLIEKESSFGEPGYGSGFEDNRQVEVYSYSLNNGFRELLYQGVGDISNISLSKDEKTLMIELRNLDYSTEDKTVYNIEAIIIEF